MANNGSDLLYFNDHFVLANLFFCRYRFGLYMDCGFRIMILPRILYDKFPSYTWAHNAHFDLIEFRHWQADYEKWKIAKTIKAKDKIAQKWAAKPKSKYYKKRGTFRGYKKRK